MVVLRIENEFIRVLDAFCRECGSIQMFRDNDDDIHIPRGDFLREIVTLNKLFALKLIGINLPMKLATFETRELYRLLKAADYLNCSLQSPIARTIATRLAGKTPADMARILDVEYTPNGHIEYARANWLVPINAVKPWPRSFSTFDMFPLRSPENQQETDHTQAHDDEAHDRAPASNPFV